MAPSILLSRTDRGRRKAFHPRMASIREGVSVIGELKYRSWSGVVADLWDAQLDRGAKGEYLSQFPRLFILLDHKGGDLETRLSADAALPDQRGGSPSMSFIPAGLRLWVCAEQAARIRHLDLHFDPERLAERLGEELDRDRLADPQFMVADERILSLARLIAEECASPDLRSDLYGDSLTLALLIDLMGFGRKKERKRTPLSSWQLRRVTEFIEENCARSIRLQELAELLDLSQSYFSHAFKASTGMPPHQWQINARVRRVQERLLLGDAPIPVIAAETGFSDQAHLTRIFRRVVGETPAAWQRVRRVR
jgi:AraC family transcriptional regulator